MMLLCVIFVVGADDRNDLDSPDDVDCVNDNGAVVPALGGGGGGLGAAAAAERVDDNRVVAPVLGGGGGGEGVAHGDGRVEPAQDDLRQEEGGINNAIATIAGDAAQNARAGGVGDGGLAAGDEQRREQEQGRRGGGGGGTNRVPGEGEDNDALEVGRQDAQPEVRDRGEVEREGEQIFAAQDQEEDEFFDAQDREEGELLFNARDQEEDDHFFDARDEEEADHAAGDGGRLGRSAGEDDVIPQLDKAGADVAAASAVGRVNGAGAVDARQRRPGGCGWFFGGFVVTLLCIGFWAFCFDLKVPQDPKLLVQVAESELAYSKLVEERDMSARENAVLKRKNTVLERVKASLEKDHAVVEEKLRAGAEVAREAAELKARVEELEILLTQAQTSRREAEAQAQAAGWMAGHVNSKLINERDALARRALVLEAEIGAFPGKLLEAQGNAKRLREEVRAKQRIVEAEREARETIEQASEEVRAMLDDQRDEQARVLTTPRFTSTTIAFWRVMAERRISTKARKDHLVNAKAREEHWAQLVRCTGHPN